MRLGDWVPDTCMQPEVLAACRSRLRYLDKVNRFATQQRGNARQCYFPPWIIFRAAGLKALSRELNTTGCLHISAQDI